MLIVMVSAEGLPYIKSGGLADVIGSLPRELSSSKNKVVNFLPLYKKVVEKYFDDLEFETSFKLVQAKFNSDVRIFSHVKDGVKTYFIENAHYFERDAMYGYDDDGERFAFFDHAVLTAIEKIGLKPDIIHCHDWHAGMVPVLAREVYKDYQTKFIFTIHNLAYQGLFHKDILTSCFGLSLELYENGKLAFYPDMISCLKAGVIYSDKISTVSNQYAKEILTSEFGENMEYVLSLREHDLWGIVNGIDDVLFDPMTDKNIAVNYNVKNIEFKKKNKIELQKSLGLRVDENVCVVGMVTRLTWQKGVQLVLNKIRDLMGLDIQLVILGSGDASYEHDLKNCEAAYRRRMAFYCGYNEKVAQQIYAGADLFLMPSLFEPCGISQLISMRYGTVPIVREVGGLKDTVIPFNEFELTGTGFTFTHFNEDELYGCVRRAVDVFYDYPGNFNGIIVRGMLEDVSWKKSAKLYIQMYEQII